MAAPKLLFVFGTRPEIIKLFSVIRAARADDRCQVRLCATGQHRQMLDSFMALFGLVPDCDLDVMVAGQTLNGLSARLLERLDAVLADEKPDAVIVQGDTTTAMAGALAAFHRGVPVAHVEAGLRTWDLQAPFPEEFNRQLVGRLARWHLPPTQWAADNLRREGVPEDRIAVTGQTGIDTLLWARDHLLPQFDLAARFPYLDDKPLLLITGHRRESFGAGFEDLCWAIRELVESRPDLRAVYPVHLNPNVQAPVQRILGPAAATGRLHLEPPLDYLAFTALLLRCRLVLTDSGGVQEEAPSLGKPVLCMRAVTERPEGVNAGAVRLVGTDRQAIVAAVSELLDNPEAYRQMAEVRNPYGDGRAAPRVIDAILRG